MFLFDEDTQDTMPARIIVMGVGGGGCNAISTMIAGGLGQVEFAVANTDLQVLRSSAAGAKLQLGARLTKGLGAGANPQIGRDAAIEDSERRATLSAAYALVAFVTVPFLMFAVPRMYASLHPDTVINARGKIEMSSDIKTVFFAANLAFLALFLWLYNLDRKVSRILREARP